MSSDDSGFDKEAEREKLREKYEQDQQGRENTRRMSELLLQGATMTGKHCDRCGDPIFRYDGQEFCPSCQQEVDGNAARGDAADAGEATAPEGDGTAAPGRTDAPVDESVADESDASAGRENAAASDEATDDEPRVEIDGVRVADRHVDRSDVRRPPSKQESSSKRKPPSRRGGDGRRTADRHREHARDAGEGGRSGHDPTTRESPVGADTSRVAATGDLDPARETLVRTLSDLASRAEQAEDVARTRELLAATREAAEALAALDRANR